MDLSTRPESCFQKGEQIMCSIQLGDITERLNGIERGRRYWIVTRGIGLFISIIAFHILIFLIGADLPASPIGARVHLLATSIFASGILSFALIAVYWDIRDTQAEQTEILDSQQSLMEASHLPALDIRDIEPNPNDDELKMTVENTGNGPALSLSATIHICPVDPGSGSYSMPRFPNRENWYRPLTRDDGSGSTAIQTDDTGEYVVEVFVPDFSTRGSAVDVTRGINNLVDQGIQQVDLQVVVRFEHLIPTREPGFIYRRLRRADINQGMSFYDLWNSSSSWVGQPIDFENSEEPFRDQGQYYGN
jgi:hypothetical protein